MAALKQGSVAALMQDQPQSAEKELVEGVHPQEETIPKDFKNQPYTPETLTAAWNAFADKIQVEKPIISAMLKKHPPVIVAPNTVEVAFGSQTELGYILQERPALLLHLYEQLENNQIQLVTRELEQGEQKQEIYTNEEKFQYLKELNPLVETLKNALDLDFE